MLEVLRRKQKSRWVMIRGFTVRLEDVVRAEGCAFSDGSIVVRWLPLSHSTIMIYPDLRSMYAGIGADHIVQWQSMDAHPFIRGVQDAYDDHCLRCPFATFGGPDLQSRQDLLQGHVHPPDGLVLLTSGAREDYLNGYRWAANVLYGSNWRKAKSLQWIRAPGRMSADADMLKELARTGASLPLRDQP